MPNPSKYTEVLRDLLRHPEPLPQHSAWHRGSPPFTPQRFTIEEFERYGFPPRPSSPVQVKVFCSVIHVDSALAMLWARSFLRNTGWEFKVCFDRTSSQASAKFQNCALPALVTVTEGTAKRIEESRAGKMLLEAPPGRLRWTSPQSGIEVPPLADLQRWGASFVVTDHPTDLAAFSEFGAVIARASGTEVAALGLETRFITTVPEHRTEYEPARGKGKVREFSLTNSFMDKWALLGREPTALPGSAAGGWDKVERRFIYANRHFLEQRGGGRSFASWFQFYLKYYLFLDSTHEIRKYFVENIRQFEGTYLREGRIYLGAEDA